MLETFENLIVEVKDIDMELEFKKISPYRDDNKTLSGDFLEDYLRKKYVRDILVRNLTWVYPSKDNFNLILAKLTDSKNILDVGCGTGIFGKYILKLKKNYTGLRLKSKYHLDDINLIDESHIVEFKATDKDPNADIPLKEYLKNAKEDTWLLIWPSYQTDLATITLKAFESNPYVKKLIYIGELYGCTGTYESSDILDRLTEDKLNYNSRYCPIDSYSCISDRLLTVEKKIDFKL